MSAPTKAWDVVRLVTYRDHVLVYADTAEEAARSVTAHGDDEDAAYCEDAHLVELDRVERCAERDR